MVLFEVMLAVRINTYFVGTFSAYKYAANNYRRLILTNESARRPANTTILIILVRVIFPFVCLWQALSQGTYSHMSASYSMPFTYVFTLIFLRE